MHTTEQNRAQPLRYHVDMQKVEYRVFEGNMSPFWLARPTRPGGTKIFDKNVSRRVVAWHVTEQLCAAWVFFVLHSPECSAEHPRPAVRCSSKFFI